MQRAVRSFAVAGAALVGAGVLAASPAPAPLQQARWGVQSLGVRLVANSIANIPSNVVQTIANIPAVQYQAVGQTVAALEKSGNWWLYIPTNVVGFDQQDLQKVNAISLILMPVPLVAAALADQLSITLAAEAPMTPDCTGIPGPCTDPIYFHEYFQVPVSQLISGYTFPADLENPIEPNDPSVQPEWAGQTVTLDPIGPVKAIWQTLTQDPAESILPAPTNAQWTSALDDFAQATWASVNPFVPGTYCLPCQRVVAGAPDSLPKFALFGEYYTVFNLGQQLTDSDWVGNPYNPTGDPDWIQNAQVTNIWTRQAWDQIYADAVNSVKGFADQLPALPMSTKTDLAAAAAQVSALLRSAGPATAAQAAGNVKGLKAVTDSFDGLASMAGVSLPSVPKTTAPVAGTKALAAAGTAIAGALGKAPVAGDPDPRPGAGALFGSRERGRGPNPSGFPKLGELRVGLRDAAESLRGGAGLAGLKQADADTQKAQTSREAGDERQRTPAKLALGADAGTAASGTAGQPGKDQPAGEVSDRARKPRGPIGAAAKSAGERLSKAASKVADGLKGARRTKIGDARSKGENAPAARPGRGRADNSGD